jgi:hypothetical protein
MSIAKHPLIMFGTKPAAPSGSYLTDTYTTKAIWSLEREAAAYTGPMIKVRRTAGSPATADFTEAEITNGTLAAWVGVGNDGFIDTWYEQLFGYNYVQTTTSLQPRIVLNGVVETLNGKPAVQFIRASNTRLVVLSSTALFNHLHQEPHSVMYIGSLVQAGTAFSVLLDSTNAANALSRGMWVGLRNTVVEQGVARSITGAYAAYQNNGGYSSGNQHLYWVDADPKNATANQRLKAFLNAGAAVNVNADSGAGTDGNANGNLTLGALGNGTGAWDGKAQKVVLFPDQSSNRTAIRDSEKTRYAIY